MDGRCLGAVGVGVEDVEQGLVEVGIQGVGGVVEGLAVDGVGGVQRVAHAGVLAALAGEGEGELARPGQSGDDGRAGAAVGKLVETVQ